MRFRVILAALLIAVSATIPALAQEPTATDLRDDVHVEHFRVVVNDVPASDDAAVYLANDQTVYVSDTDLLAWNLKVPQQSAFQRDGKAYYGLQTDAGLATSFDRAENQLNIVAPAGAFIGQRDAGPPDIAPGRGSFMNYNLRRENGDNELYAARGYGVYRMRYLYTAGAAGVEFHRGQTEWYRFNPKTHTLWEIGEATSSDNWLATDAPFLGARFSSEFVSDPTYRGHGSLAVSGVADTPSFLEAFVENVSVLRMDVPQGPFTVRDLPPSAARSDVVMVLTGADGKKTIQIGRPSVDPEFIARGKMIYDVEGGIGEVNRNSKNTYYRHGVFSGGLRYGLTNTITGEIFAESINRENFADAGADIRLAPDRTFAFRIGGGNKRRAAKARLDLQEGKFRFSEEFQSNSLKAEPIEGFDFGDVAALNESVDLSIDISPKLSFGLRLNRSRDSQGSDASMLAPTVSFRGENRLSLNVSPFYDFVRHRVSANMSVSFSAGKNRRLTQRSSITARRETSAALEYRKDAASPDDPIAYEAQISANRSQDRSFTIGDTMPWASAGLRIQEQNATRVFEPDLTGALAFVGGHVFALRSISNSESFGVVHLPGLRNVRVSVNSEPMGRTDAQGDLFVKTLRPWRDNTITVNEEDLPLGVDLQDPQHVVPASASPADVTIPIVSRGGFTVEVFDENGRVPEPGSTVRRHNASYIVGYGGRTYVTGINPGVQQLTASIGASTCVVTLKVPTNLDEIPDLGRQVCRKL